MDILAWLKLIKIHYLQYFILKEDLEVFLLIRGEEIFYGKNLDVTVHVDNIDVVIVIFQSNTIWQVGNQPYFGIVTHTPRGRICTPPPLNP